MSESNASSPAMPSEVSIGTRGSRIVPILITNAIPLFGVLHYHWSATNVLVLYWLENLLIAVFTCLRIALHCHLTRLRGHWRTDPLSSSPGKIGKRPTLLRDYTIASLVFTLGHGVFVVAIAFMLTYKYSHSSIARFALEPLLQGALLLLGTLSIQFLFDFAGLRSRSFAWIKGCTGRGLGRVLTLHLAIVIGIFAMGTTESPLGMLYVLIGLKLLLELAMSGASDTATPGSPTPPRWLKSLADRMNKDKVGGTALAQQWNTALEEARQRDMEDERPMAKPAN